MAYVQTRTIGGTAVSQILGRNKWGGPWDAWRRITGRFKVPENAAMRRGTRLEGPVAEVAEDALGMTLIEPATGTKIIDDVFSGTVDRFAYDGEDLAGIVEIKTAGTFSELTPVPEHYALQLQHYLWCFNLRCGWLVGLKAEDDVLELLDDADDVRRALDRGVAELVIHKVTRDPFYADMIIPRLRDWFKSYVETDTPPPADGSDGCRDGLCEFYTGTADVMEMTDEAEVLITKRMTLKEAEKNIIQERKSVENQLRQLIGEHRAVKGRGLSFTVSKVKGKMKLDSDSFERDHPGLMASFMVRGNPYERFTFKETTDEVPN